MTELHDRIDRFLSEPGGRLPHVTPNAATGRPTDVGKACHRAMGGLGTLALAPASDLIRKKQSWRSRTAARSAPEVLGPSS